MLTAKKAWSFGYGFRVCFLEEPGEGGNARDVLCGWVSIAEEAQRCSGNGDMVRPASYRVLGR
jgi:hypothetical protein